MIKRIAINENSILPRIITYTNIRSYLLTLVLVGLSISIPQIFHRFNLAGPTFLPMHIFILVAGLLFGWRAGVVIGFFSPLISFGISGMPVANILPQTVIELSTYGFVSGMLREKTNLRIIWSLLAAMVAGRLALLLTVSIFHIGRAIYSPLGIEASPVSVLWSVISQGWPGIVIQLAAIPFIVKLGQRIMKKNRLDV